MKQPPVVYITGHLHGKYYSYLLWSGDTKGAWIVNRKGV